MKMENLHSSLPLNMDSTKAVFTSVPLVSFLKVNSSFGTSTSSLSTSFVPHARLSDQEPMFFVLWLVLKLLPASPMQF